MRHGESEWSLSGQQTRTTDLPLALPENNRRETLAGSYYKGRRFGFVLTNPLLRARETCRLAGDGDNAVVDPNLPIPTCRYGTTENVKEGLPVRFKRNDRAGRGATDCPGESIQQVATRAEGVIDRVLAGSGDALLFAHGHILRIVAGRWLGLPPQDGRLFALATAALTTLGYEHET